MPQIEDLAPTRSAAAVPIPGSAGQCIHGMFETQVRRTPDSIAVIDGTEQFTYQQLNIRSNRIAHHLIRHGIGPEHAVGVFLGRSIDLVAGILGILKAGGAYVPLDPAYPAERLAYLLEDSGTRIIVTCRADAGGLPSHSLKVVNIGESMAEPSATDDENPEPRSAAENLAYLIYTSGSTGRPKGVAIEHRNVVSLLHWAQRLYSARELSGVLASTSICFDLSVFELFVPLASGGSVILAENALQLPMLPAADKVTLINTVPSAMAELVRAGGIPRSVVTVNLAGERLLSRLADAIYQTTGVSRVYDLYGPSEDTVYSTCALRQPGGVETIGRAIDGKMVHLLDEHGQPVVNGNEGEIHISGEGLARGYLGRADLTAERFISDPSGSGRRLYRTGDRARWLKDGNLCYLGRFDHQVKIRGFRIELGEIESVLGGFDGVTECIVTVYEEEEDTPRLVAYLVAADPASPPSPTELRQYLGERLPAHFVPGGFVILDQMPRTPNGKTDRKALPAPDFSHEPVAGHVAPESPLEKLIAGIWEDVLRVKSVGLNDDFFELGGHSLLAARVASRINQALSLEVSLRLVIEFRTVAALAGRVSELPEKSNAAPRLPGRMPRTGNPPLSPGQLGIWMRDQFEDTGSEYVMPEAFRIRGALDVPILIDAVRMIATRHEILRTRFEESEGIPFQAIEDDCRIPVTVENHAGSDEDERLRITDEAIRREIDAGFDLRMGPLLRLRVLRFGDEDFVLIRVWHHIISDAWSMTVFDDELAEIYQALSGGRGNPLEPLPVQFADHVIWQDGELQGERLDRLRDYWAQRLDGAPRQLDFPSDRQRAGDSRKRGGSVSLDLPRELTESLEHLSRQEQVTFFMLLLAAINVLFARYTGQEDIVIGAPIAGRKGEWSERLIGFFVGTLALRCDLSGNPDFVTLLRQVRSTTLDAYDHQELSAEAGRSPRFQVFFNMQSVGEPAMLGPGLETRRLEVPDVDPLFDMTFYAIENAGDLRLRVLFNAELFDEETIGLMLRRFQVLLESIVAEPGKKIGALPLRTIEERRQRSVYDQAVCPRNAFEHIPDEDLRRSLPERFEGIVSRFPEAVAVTSAKHTWTYDELNRKANAVARAVLAAGGHGMERVGLLLDHDAPMLACILGVLKAGKAYVPLDPRHPEQRLGFILGHAGAEMLITDSVHQEVAEALAARCGVRVICYDDSEIPENPGISISPDSVAYLLFTSGSTGDPKGVTQLHGNVLAHIRAYTHSLHLSADDRVSLLAGFAFDAAVMDVFGALLNGARLCLFDVRGQGPGGIGGWMAAEEVTIYHSTPTLFRHVTGLLPQGCVFPKVRLVVLGGEKVVPGDLDAHRRHFPQDSIFVNGYGPTESTVTLQCFLNADSSMSGGMVPVGYPVEDTEVLLLNPDGDDGQIHGEIAIRSRHVAEGYWREPEMTAGCFSDDPSGDGRRIYRTGDLGRLLGDGMIVHAGRKDFQVKIRGHRVEPGEIEAVLAAEPDIAEAAVAVYEPTPSDNRLVAFVVAASSAAPDPAELRQRIGKRLPAYMIPESITILESLPLTASGKVDRKRLPVADCVSLSTCAEHVVPRTPTEQGLAQIWAEVLDREKIGIHDNFFELGGHSLLAARMISRISRAFSAELPFGRVFEFPTIAALAGILDSTARSESRPRPVPVDRSGKLRLSFAQQRMWFLSQLEDSGTRLNLPSGLLLRGVIDLRILDTAIQTIIARHEILRTRFCSSDGEPYQVVEPELRIELALEELDGLDKDAQAEAIESAFANERAWCFDLSRTPLIRIRLLKLGVNEFLLLRNWHHIVTDAWSSGVFHQELIASYQSFSDGENPLPPLPLQYADFAGWQRQMLGSPDFDGHLDYWRSRLADVVPLELPLDHPRPPRQAYSSMSHPLVLSTALSAKLKRFNRSEKVTPFMTFLAAFQVLLARHSGQEDIAVGTPVANRGNIELEELIGFFANTVVIRGDLTGQPGFRDLVAQVRTLTVEAYHHQDVPFDKLVETLNPARDPSRHPLFQVMFVLDGSPSGLPELRGIETSPYPDPSGTTQFDLGLELSEVGETWSGRIVYDSALFNPETIARMAGHFELLLTGMLEAPERPVSEIPMLSAAERHRLLVEWNDTRRSYPAEKRIHQLIAERALGAPDAVAVICGESKLSYRDLDGKANALAILLGEAGIGKGHIVPVVMKGCPELIVAELAVMKAGAAFVPVDPDWPVSRIETILDRVSAKVVLTTRDADASPVPAIVVDLEKLDGVMEPPAIVVSPDDPIYVIFTSGSTGTPKAAVNHHSGISNRFHNMNDRFGGSENDVILATTSSVFDSSVWQYFWPLTNGARTVLPAASAATDPDQLIELLAVEQVTVTDFSPSLLAMIVERLDVSPHGAGRLDSLRQVLVGGEAIHPPTTYRFKSHLPQVNVTNAYGPTETSIGVIFHDLPEQPVSRIPIGKPLFNVHAVILDRHRNPVPQGVPGELYIGGVCVGLGYLNDPAASAAVFVPNPFPELAGGTLYKTGDLARHLPNGNIEFLGRVDHQLQIRGFRIEPREVEVVLECHPDIEQALAVGRGIGHGGTALVAYLVPVQGAVAPEPPELRAFLKNKLPDYMVPSAFVALEEFPLTAGGKIDRKALPAPTGTGFGGTGPILNPRDELEWLLEAIWERVLEVEPIGIDQNFFDLGGHSLLVVRLLSEVEKLTGVRPGLADFFSDPTIKGQATVVREGNKESREPGLITLRSQSSGRPVFWAPSVGDIERAVESVQLAGVLPESRPMVAFDAAPECGDIDSLADHCIRLMRSIQPSGPYAIAGFCQCGHVAFEIARKLKESGEEIELLAVISASARSFPCRTTRQHFSRIRDNLKAGPKQALGRIGKIIGQRFASQPAINPSSAGISRYQAHDLAVARHRPRYCDNEILLILSESDACEANEFMLGWDALGPVSLRKIDAPHTRILRNPNVLEVGECLAAYLSEGTPNSDSFVG